MRHLDEGTLQAWLDRDRSGLAADERAAVEEHLARCDDCARRLGRLAAESSRVETLLSAPVVAEEAVPPFESVQKRADRARRGGRRRSRWAVATWAASVAAAVGVGWMANEVYRSDVARPAAEGARATRSAAAPGAGTAEASPDTAPVVIADRGDVVEETGPGAGQDRATADVRQPEATGETAPGARVAEAAEGAAEPTEETADARRELAEAATPVSDAVVAPEERPADAVVRGRVTDESGRPLEAARVYAADREVGAVTGADGSFELRLPVNAADSASPEVTLRAELIGYAGASRTLPLRSGDSVSAELSLESRAVALDQLVVTSREETPTERSPEMAERAARRTLAAAPAAAGDAGGWRTVEVTEAEARGGFRPFRVPDLPVKSVELRQVEGRTRIRVVQKLDDGRELVLVQGRGPLALDEPAEGVARASISRDDVTVVGTAAVSPEALADLLERLER